MTKIFFEVFANVEIARKHTFKRYKKGEYLIIRPKTINANSKVVLANLGLLYKVLYTDKNKVFVKQVKYMNYLDDNVLKLDTDKKDKK